MSRWIPRLRARHRLRHQIGLWYHPRYAAPQLRFSSRVPNVLPERAERVLGDLLRRGFITAGRIRVPRPASFQTLCDFHSPAYLESTTEADTLAHIFGLAAADVDVDPLLAAQRLAVGGTVEAAEAAVAGTVRLAINLGGGFHHAQPDRGAGFCVYNDVGTAIAHLRRRGFVGRIAVIDLDYHQGDGNLVAFADDPSVLAYSVHGSVWSHLAGTANLQLLLPGGTDDRTYLTTLDETLPAALAEHHPELIFYVAGNDVLAGDSLGDFALTLEGVLARDQRVARLAAATATPLVVTLAGGYSSEAWVATSRFVRWLLTDRVRPLVRQARDPRTYYEQIARRIDPMELQREGDFTITEADIMGDLLDRHHGHRLLEYYSKQGVELALERYGFLARLRRRGFTDLDVVVLPDDPSHQIVRVYGRKMGHRADERMLLVELVVRRRILRAPAELEDRADLELLSVEWLLMQDPSADFEATRPQLPGQQYPGLGVAVEVQELLVQVCHRLGLDGIIEHPSHFHVASTAARAERGSHFLDPVAEGRFRAMAALLEGVPLGEASEAVAAGRLVLGDGSAVGWRPESYVLPVSARLRTYFASPAYRDAVERAQRSYVARGLRLRPAAAAVRAVG